MKPPPTPQRPDQTRLEHELEIAREMLRALEPPAVPTLPGLDMAGLSVTPDVVGGDYYDFIPYPDQQIGLSIADAWGRGLPAAVLATGYRAMLHALVGTELRLRATFGRINKLLHHLAHVGRFVTAFYGILDVVERRMVYVNAGHPPPLVLRRDGGCERLRVTAGVLGLAGDPPIREAYVNFKEGDCLVLFTDGVTDVGSSPDEFYDVEGLEASVRRLAGADARSVCEAVVADICRHAGGQVDDDCTIVVVRFASNG